MNYTTPDIEVITVKINPVGGASSDSGQDDESM